MTIVKRRDNPVWHDTGLLDRGSGRTYLVAETPMQLLMRMKGTRTVVKLPWNIAYMRAAWIEAERIKRERLQNRKARSVKRGMIGGMRAAAV